MSAEWATKPLGEICEFSNGLWTGKKPPFEQAIVVRNTNFRPHGRLDYSDVALLDVEVKQLAKRRLRLGDIIIEKSGGGPKQPVGRVAYFDKSDGVYSFSNFTSAARVLNKSEADPEYLIRFLDWCYISGVTEGMQSHSTGIRNLDFSAYKAIEVPLPPLEEQRRIVAVLEEAFAAIAIATVNAEKNLANARELFEVQRERILRTSAGGWQESALSNLCTIKHGFAFKSEYFCDNGEYTLLTPGNFLESGGYRDRGAKQKYYDGPVPNGFILNGGDLLVAMTEQAAGLLGSPILVPTSGVYLHNQRLGLFQPRPGVEWANEFFFHVFNTSHLRNQLHRTGTGQKVRHTSPGKIGDVVVRFPATAAEQSAVASRLDDLWSQTEQLYDIYRDRLEKLTLLKQSLLHRAFSGELKSKAAAIVARNDNFATPEFAAKIVAFAYERHVAKNRIRNFGTVKAEKILHMVEAIGGIDLGRAPLREAAGPDDAKHRHATWDWARSQHFFRFNKRSGGGHDFEKLSSYSGMIEDARTAIAGTGVEKAIELLVDMDRDFAELIATTYAAWNNLIIDQCPASDGDIVLAARDKWHRDKLRFDPSRFHDAIRFIRNNSIVPDGTAKRVGGQEALLF